MVFCGRRLRNRFGKSEAPQGLYQRSSTTLIIMATHFVGMSKGKCNLDQSRREVGGPSQSLAGIRSRLCGDLKNKGGRHTGLLSPQQPVDSYAEYALFRDL
jgi:hypothetical protein